MQSTSDVQVIQAENGTVPMEKRNETGTLLERINSGLNYGLAWLAGIAMLLMMLLIVSNVISRALYVPIQGTSEIVGWLSAITIAFALGYTQINRGHVDMDFLLTRFPKRFRNLVHCLVLAICMIFFAVISYRLVLYANDVMKNGTLSETLAVIFYPLIYLVAIGFFGLTVALLTDCVKLLQRGAQK